jgi:uncharacterized protein YcnI
VPNEKDSAETTKLEVTLPTDNPIASVALKPMAGWAATTEKAKLATPIKTDDGELTEAVSKITWTADAANAIKPGQFQEFDVSLGPLPKTDQIVFKALQTYSDGDIVRWIEIPTGSQEPGHPAPVLKLAVATGEASTTSSAGPSAVSASSKSSTEGDSINWLGLAGVAVGLAGLVAGLLAYRRAGQTS